MGIIPKLHKNFDQLSTLRQEEAKRKYFAEEEELIDEMGQDSEKKAAPIVQKYVAQLEQEQKEEYYKDVECLIQFSNNKQKYQRYLLFILSRYLKEEDISKKYTLMAESTDEGIVLGLGGSEYISAFKTCGIPQYDIHACKILAVKTGNTVARLEGHFRVSEGGIALANKQELEILTRQFNNNHGRNS